MSDVETQRPLNELVADADLVSDALKRAQDAAIRLHRAYNIPMAISRNGKVVEVSPFDLQTEEERTLQK